MKKRSRKPRRPAGDNPQRHVKLTVERLEKRLAPAVAAKKAPFPPPYPPGADYGLVRRGNLSW